MNMEISKERMLEMAQKLAKMDFCPEQKMFYKNVLELLQADVEGRILVLPVTLGEPCSVRRIAEETTIVDGILQYAALVVSTEKEDMLMHPCNVFANREETEETMEKMVGESCV